MAWGLPWAKMRSRMGIMEVNPKQERIQVNPDIHFGKPCITGTRIPVQAVLELIAEGASFPDIIQEYYPDLQVADIRACVQYTKRRG